MAANPTPQEVEETGSSWPLPPMQYINNYSDEQVALGTTPLPPMPITTESYSMFGAPFHPNENIIRSLESQGMKRLYPQNYDHKRELKKMNQSLLANFLDLLQILVTAPESEKRGEKIEDIQLIFINMHHLINEYRKHQARETIRVMLTVQKKQRLEIAERFQKQLEKISENLNTYLNTIPSTKAGLPDSSLSIKSEPMDTAAESDSKDATLAEIETLDKLMCSIIDEEIP